MTVNENTGFLSRFETRWVVLAGGFLILFMGGGRMAIFGLVFKPMSEDLGLSRATLSSVVTVSTIVAAPTLLLTGRLIDRYSLRVIMLVATIISGLSITAMGLVHAPWQVFLIYGVAFPLANPATALLPVQVMISRWFQRGHGLANSVAQSGSSLGQVVLIGLLATFLGEIGWRAAFTILGIVFMVSVIPLVATMVPAQKMPRPSRNAPGVVMENEPPAPSFRKLLGNGPLWSLSVIYFICGLHDTFVTTHFVAFATDEGVSQQTAGQLLAVMGLSALAGVLVAGALADSIGAGAATMICFVLRIAIFALVIANQSDVAIFLFGLTFAFTFPITAPLVTVFMRDLFGLRNLAAFSSFILMVHQIGGGIGALTGGLLFDLAGSYGTAFLLMIGLAVTACVATSAYIRLVPHRVIQLAPAPVETA